MDFQSFKNVWGKCNRNTSNSFGTERQRSCFKMDGRWEFKNNQVEQWTPDEASQCRHLTFGAFG